MPIPPYFGSPQLQINVFPLKQVAEQQTLAGFPCREEDIMTVAALRRFAGDRKGNVAIIFAFSLMPIAMLTGMGVDYTVATQKKAILDAAADAAALAAVTPTLMAQPASASITAAQNMFNSQVANTPGLNYVAANLAVNAVDNGLKRTVTVNYTASSQNSFSGVLGQNAWALAGTSQSTSSVAPNIDFYLLLDNSPSMAIAATSAGIATMVANTKSQGGGCAFACHETNPKGDNLGNPNNEDNYTLAKNLGVVTRIQNLNSATQSLMDTATSMMVNYKSVYTMGVYTFNTKMTNVAPRLSTPSTAKALSASIDVLQVYQNGQLTQGNNNNDEDTDFEGAMSAINAVMPAPGSGMAGNSPEEVLFIVSDGVDDNKINGSRNQAMFDTSYCTTVKNRGIRIAVLYTTYLPLPTNAWYNSYIAPFQAQISGNMQNCASAGLFFEVKTDQDITAAMNALFQQAVATARLTQ
jgi:Flp pilus assembly protein TadG